MTHLPNYKNMIELFTDVPQYVKDLAKGWVDLALQQSNPLKTVQIMNDFTNSCLTDRDKEFVEFYFQLRLEQLKNENNND